MFLAIIFLGFGFILHQSGISIGSWTFWLLMLTLGFVYLQGFRNGYTFAWNEN